MLSLRKRIFLAIGLIVLLIILLLIIIFSFSFFKKQQVEKNKQENKIQAELNNQDVNENQNIINEIQTKNVQNIKNAAEPSNYDELYVEQLAKIFIERYASYSNQNNYENFSDIRDLATDRLMNWLLSNKVDLSNDEYKGLTSVVVASKVLEFNEDKAKVYLDVQQTKQIGIKVEKINNSVKVDLVKNNNQWLVDGVWWSKNIDLNK